MATNEHDIIIIGAGTAGCVLANRLSEDPDLSILVLEAGQDKNHDERVSTPGLGLELLDNPDYDWQYISEPGEGISGRRMKTPRGKILGGSSAINSFALIYPSKAGLDAWADLGNAGWDWEGTKKYFRKFQTVAPVSDEVRRELRPVKSGEGTNGPISAIYPLTVNPLAKAWLGTFEALGLENTKDPLDGEAIGGHITTNHITAGRHERSHAGVAYFEPVRHRSNLTLVTGAQVRRILFEKNSSTSEAIATGVAYIKDGVEHTVHCSKEVILAAGAFGSPQVLELSGIGDSSRLAQHGIDTIYHNSNVGENLQDHIRPSLSFELAPGTDIQDPLPLDEARKQYIESRTGPWAERACFTFAYMPLEPFLTSPEEKARVEALLNHHLNDPSLPSFIRKRDAFIKAMILSPTEGTATAFLARRAPLNAPPTGKYLSLQSMLSHPFSRGSSHIASADPTTKPRIDYQYYTHPLDLEIHGRHIQALSKIAATPPMSKYINFSGTHYPPNAADLTLEEAKQVIRDFASTNYHPCGTCSMMSEGMGGVVDARLKVYGTRNVRVVDASVQPIIPRGNILTTVYAVAEKAADLVSLDLGVKRST